MTRSKRLGPVAKLARGAEREAVRQLGVGQKTLQDQRARLDELKRYRDEYARGFVETLEGGLQAAATQQHRGFLARLSEAIHTQEALVANTERELEARRGAWLERRARAAALDGVVEGHRQAERRDQSRREQRQQDAYGARRWKPRD